MKKETILIVDDDINIVNLIQLHLELEGYNCITANNGEAAFNLTLQELPDLVLLDIMMPKMDGWEVCTKIKETDLIRRIPIIMITAKSHKDDLKRGWELGVTDYITKPFSPTRLVEIINKVLSNKKIEESEHSSEYKNSFKDVNIALVGSSKAGISIIQFLLGDSRVNIKGISDTSTDSPSMELARKLGIYSTTNIKELLKIKDIKIIFVLSDDKNTLEILNREKPPGVEIIRGKTAGFIWYLIEQSAELEEKERSLLKELNLKVNELSNLNKELKILYEGSKLMGATIDINSTLETSLKTMAKAINADSGVIVLLDEETDEWMVYISYQIPLEQLKEKLSSELIKGIGENVLKNKRPVVIENIADKKETFPFENIKKIVSTIALPLFTKDEVFGLVYLNHNIRKDYSQDEIYILSALSNQASVSIENAKLYETIKQKHEAVEQLLNKLIGTNYGDVNKLNENFNRINLSVFETIKSLETCFNSLNADLNRIKGHINEMDNIAGESLIKIKNLEPSSSSEDVQEIDLLPAIESYLHKFEAETAIASELIISGVKRKLGSSIESTIYSIIQEAMKNVKIHSKALNLRVRVKILSDQFNVSIEDDGIGFEQAKIFASTGCIGINKMKEKATFLGGTFKIRSHPGRGTVVLLRIPIPADMDFKKND